MAGTSITKIHLNAGASQRVVDYIKSIYTVNNVENTENNSTILTFVNLSEWDRIGLTHKLKSVYPIEFEDSWTSSNATTTEAVVAGNPEISK
jgi:hypothetical protein